MGFENAPLAKETSQTKALTHPRRYRLSLYPIMISSDGIDFRDDDITAGKSVGRLLPSSTKAMP